MSKRTREIRPGEPGFEAQMEDYRKRFKKREEIASVVWNIARIIISASVSVSTVLIMYRLGAITK